jgi:hypothetical protein
MHLLFQESIAVRIHGMQALGLCNRDMIVSYTNDRSILLMSPVHPSEFLASSGTGCKPDIAELRQIGTWDSA